jgi:hypothetical protein
MDAFFHGSTILDPTSNNNMTSPSFLDRFTLHLAANLLGTRAVLDRLKQDKNNINKKSLYWRSKLFDDDPLGQGCWPDSTSSTTDNDHKILFLDLTFDFDVDDNDNKNPKLSLRFGCFLLQQPSCRYVQGSPLTMTQLEQHAQSVGIDLHSAPPKAMAGIMAKELLAAAAANTNTKIQLLLNKDDKNRNQFQLSLYYRDVEESGILALDVAHSTSQWDRVGMNLFYRDLTWRDRTTEPPFMEDSKDLLDLTNQFEEWFQQRQVNKSYVSASQEAHIDESSSSKKEEEEDRPTTKLRQPAPARVNSYVQVPNKRRKKGKITYAKSS